jgi:hypothetical protein
MLYFAGVILRLKEGCARREGGHTSNLKTNKHTLSLLGPGHLWVVKMANFPPIFPSAPKILLTSLSPNLPSVCNLDTCLPSAQGRLCGGWWSKDSVS